MEWRIIGINFFYAVLGVLLIVLRTKVFDLLTPQLNFPEELKKNNTAVAIFIAALYISIGIIIGGSTFKEVKSNNPDFLKLMIRNGTLRQEFTTIAGFGSNGQKNESAPERLSFVFGSYNAGRGTILKAQNQAVKAQLDQDMWPSLEEVAPQVPKWVMKRHSVMFVKLKDFTQIFQIRKVLVISSENNQLDARLDFRSFSIF
jgi:hypothetical protein